MKTTHLVLLIAYLFFALNLCGQSYYEMADDELLELCNEGDASAMYVLGIYALEEERYADATTWLEQASELGHDMSHYELAMMHLQGLHESAAIEDALKHFEQAGELGYHEGYFELARLYDEGKLVTRDLQTAVQYYKLADSDRSTIRLGELYADNLVEGQTPEDTFHWIREASYSIPERNCLIIAGYYMQGYGTEQDKQEALEWYGRAAIFQKVPEAADLAILCYEGTEVTKDYEAAYLWGLMAQKTKQQDNPKLKSIMDDLDVALDADTRAGILESVLEMQKRWF